MRASLAVAVAVAALAGVSYTDPAGDGGGAPDLVRVTVTPSAQVLTVRAETPDPAAWDQAVALLEIDTSGDGGPDVTYTLHSEHTRVTRDTAGGPLPTRATATLDGGTLTYTVPRAELGAVAAVGIDVRTAGPSGSDRAPDAGLARVALLAFAPAKPVHGKRFSVQGATSCTATLAGRRLPGACAWQIPANAKGKALSVKVVAGAASRTYRFRVA